ncbi:restriction endonuclease subunit S [Corynebacterium hesseae]|uniref:restriction endonuclease subunit S n=1 Tax=Corynebacterium hesseae TaxID=2913502 RepID=UPI00373F1102
MASNAKHDWPMVRLGDVVEFLDHLRKPVASELRRIGEVPYYGANGQQGWIDDYLFDEELVLVAEDGGNFLHPQKGVAYKISGKAWVNNHAHVLRSTEIIDIDYVHYVLRNYDFAQYITGSTRAKLTKSNLKRVVIPLLPLDEQRRIAKILDQVDSALVRVDQFLAGLLQLKQELFTASFLEDQRELITVGEYLESTQYGTSDKANENVGIPVLRMGNVSYNGEIDLSDLKYVELDIKDREKYSLKAGDLLFNRTNSKDLVGKTAVVPALPEEYTYAGYLIRCRVNDKAVPEYISGYLNSVLGKKILRNTAKAIVGMANINANELKRLPIPKASLDEQQEFASSTSRIEEVESQMKRQRKLLQELQESLSTRAFQGDL